MAKNTKTDQSLTYEESILDQFETYDTNHYTGTQVSLFLGPVWIEEFVSIRYTERNSKKPIYGWNEMYSDTNLDGNYLINGVFVTNNIETDYIQRQVRLLREQLAKADNKEAIDKIIFQQKSKFKSRIEVRLLEEKEQNNLDFADVSKIIEKAKDRVDITINEIVNQNDNFFNYDLSVVIGNHRDVNPNIHIFEHFNILEKQISIEPDDTPLFVSYSFYARKNRSLKSSQSVTIAPTVTQIDLLRMIDEICIQLTGGFNLDNKQRLLKEMDKVVQDNIKNGKPKKPVNIYDVYSSFTFERKRGLLDIPTMEFKNESLKKTESQDLSAKINKNSQIGYNGLIKTGTNSYGDDISLNKISFTISMPETFEIDQTIYGNTYIANTNTTKQSNDLKEKYKVIIENYDGKVTHPDHQILETFGYDIIGEIFPSPFNVRGSGVLVRKSFQYKDAGQQESLWRSIYNYRNRSYITNSFLSYTEPVVKIIKKYFKTIDSGSSEEQTITNIKMPLFSFTYLNLLDDKNIKVEKETLKITKPIPVFMVDFYRAIQKPKNTSEEKVLKELTEVLVGEDNKDFYLIPVKHYAYYDPEANKTWVTNANAYNISLASQKGADFDYENLHPAKIVDIINEIYPDQGFTLLKKIQPLDKAMHFVPLTINYKKYVQAFGEGKSEYEFLEGLSKPKELKKVLINTLRKLQSDPKSDIAITPYEIHYDFLLKEASGLQPAVKATNIDMSFVHTIRKDEDSSIQTDDNYLLVIYFLLVSSTPNFQNNRELLKKINEIDSKERTRFINYKGYGAEFEWDKYSLEQNSEPIKEPKLFFNYEIGSKIVIENWVRTDFKNYNLQDSALDTFLNFLTPNFQWIDNLFGGGFKNIIKYAKEMQQYTGNLLDPETHWVKEFTGYLKSIAGGVMEGVFKLTSYINKNKTENLVNGPMSFVLSEEEILIKELNNLVAFAGDIYVNINIRKCAESIVNALIGKESREGTPNAPKLFNNKNNWNIFIKSNNSPKSKQVMNTASSYPYKDLIDYTMSTLRKKLLDFNTEDNGKLQIRTSRFMSDPQAKVVKQKPEYSDPAAKETMYVKYNSAFPMDKTVIKYAKNQDASGLNLKTYTFPTEVD